MSNVFSRTLGTPVPQSEQADSRQVANSAGGFTFTIDDKARLIRFLMLGTDGGTYYTDEKKLTKENVTFLKEIIERDEQMVMETVLEVSTSGRAFRNSPAIFAVAALFAWGKLKRTSLVRKVCRTSTMLFEFAEYVELLGGWGRAKRSAVAEWYTSKDLDNLAYQVVKYRQRNGWSHRDMLRLSHPVGLNTEVVNFILGKDYRRVAQTHDLPEIIEGFRFAQEAETISELLGLALRDYPNLPWEAIPTEYLKNVDVWKKLFYNGQLKGQALLRNITRLSRLGAWDDMLFTGDYAMALVDEEMMAKTRLHPFQYLLALSVHEIGQMNRKDSYSYGSRNKDWASNSQIVTALNEGFYKAFKYVEPAGKRTMIALDVSGSMSSSMAGIDLSAAQITAAVSMTVARTEPYYQVMGFSNRFVDLGINPSMSLNEVMNRVVMSNFGSTDCSMPMTYALERKIAVDTFIVMTDNETWAGRIHPHIALENYRQKTGINAKLIVVATTPTNFTIANPSDAGMLDICGADSNLPGLIANFSAGRF